MKKVLFATTALVMSAGIASAQGVELNGGAIFGLKDTGVAGGDVILHYEIDVNIVGSGSTDNGLTFGFSMDIDESFSATGTGAVAGGLAASTTTVTSTGQRDPEIFVSGAFGTVTVGDLDPATDAIGIGDPGFDGIGIDDDVEGVRNHGDANASYMYDVAGFEVGLFLGVEENAAPGNQGLGGDYGILLGYSFGDFGVQAAMSRDNSTTGEAYGLEATYTFDMITATAIYTMNELNGVDTTGYGLHVAYVMDALTISAAFADTDAAGDQEDYGIGAAYDLGGGLGLAGAVGSVDGNTVWDLGVTMSF